jgi:outer membrane protein
MLFCDAVLNWSRRKSSFIVLLIFLNAFVALSGASLYAAEQESLAGIYALAVSNDPILAGAEHLREATKENLTQAWSQLRPNVNASYLYTDTTQDILSSDNEVFDQGSSDFTTEEYGLTLRQPLVRLDLFRGVGQAKVEQEKADLELQAARQDMIVRVVERYLMALSAQDQVDFAKAEETAVRQHFELASGRFEMGLSPITDLHDAKARLASREARSLEADTQMVDAFEALRELTGSVPAGIVPLAGTFQPMAPVPDNADEWVETATKENLAVKGQAKLVEMSRREVGIQKAGHYPTLDLIGNFNNKTTEGSLFGGGSEVETTEFGLQFNLPLYQGGAVSSRTRQALEQQKKIEAELEKSLRETIRLARSSFLGVKNSISRIEALEQAVVSQQSTLDAKTEGYRSGLFTSLAVLDAERDLYQAKNELAQARYDYIFNNLKLRQAVGSLSADDLNRANVWFSAPSVAMAASSTE